MIPPQKKPVNLRGNPLAQLETIFLKTNFQDVLFSLALCQMLRCLPPTKIKKRLTCAHGIIFGVDFLACKLQFAQMKMP